MKTITYALLITVTLLTGACSTLERVVDGSSQDFKRYHMPQYTIIDGRVYQNR